MCITLFLWTQVKICLRIYGLSLIPVWRKWASVPCTITPSDSPIHLLNLDDGQIYYLCLINKILNFSCFVPCTLPNDQRFNLEFQFQSALKLKFQAEFGIQLYGDKFGRVCHMMSIWIEKAKYLHNSAHQMKVDAPKGANFYVPTLSEKIAHPTVYHHLSQLSVISCSSTAQWADCFWECICEQKLLTLLGR